MWKFLNVVQTLACVTDFDRSKNRVQSVVISDEFRNTQIQFFTLGSNVPAKHENITICSKSYFLFLYGRGARLSTKPSL